jgi:hypothetical protein
MSDLKASQRPTRRDVPSARKLPEAKAAAPEPNDRPSGSRRTKPRDALLERDSEDEEAIDSSR